MLFCEEGHTVPSITRVFTLSTGAIWQFNGYETQLVVVFPLGAVFGGGEYGWD